MLDENYIEQENNDYYLVKKDITLTSISFTSSLASGDYPPASPWTDWKNNKKQTLKDVYKKL